MLPSSSPSPAHGMAVALPSDDGMGTGQGNSEVGHNAPGAGCIFSQGWCCFPSFCNVELVDKALAFGKIYDGEGFKYMKESFDNVTSKSCQ
ncbi:hypothetical protein EJB05_24410 [Eragrostis curvula]|uniref:Uncharacterized protein n=1 Tax=Eragrostis curvula TaxID=38414 RepID=A0A5J9VAK8_9POAL|nr:hypothetical protein EJB05_24410 [Eragrostis curvula]